MGYVFLSIDNEMPSGTFQINYIIPNDDHDFGCTIIIFRKTSGGA